MLDRKLIAKDPEQFKAALARRSPEAAEELTPFELRRSRGLRVLNALYRVRPGASIADAEEKLILATLDHFDGDKPETAKTLGISLKTLYNRLKEYRRSRRE